MANFLDDDNDPWMAEAEAEPTPEVIEAPEPTQEQPAQAEPQEQAKEPEKTQAPAQDEAMVPSWRLREISERARTAERELEQLRANAPRPQAQAPQQAPDPYEDPVGYNAYVQQTVQETEWKMRAEMSGRFAEQIHGKDKVEAAVAWAQEQGAKDPTLGQRVQANTDPVGFVVQEYERSRTLQTLAGKSPEDFAREYAASQGWIVSEPGAPAPILKPSSPMPPKGLATAPGKGGVGQAPSGADWSEVKFALG